MIICIAGVLDAEALGRIHAGLAKARFIDGKATAGWHARLVKENTQVAGDDPVLAPLQRQVEAALRRNKLFELAVRPKALRPVLFSRYQPGMSYGTHVDDAVMGGMRTDIAFTLFLSDPADYDGGELIVESTAGEQEFKLPAGAAVAYPANTLHRVAEVTRGERLAAVGWVRSLVRDPAARELLFDLETARRSLFDQHGKTPEFDLLSRSIANLLRRWVED